MIRSRHSLFVLSLIAAAGCGEKKSAEPAHPVVLVGFDGMTWKVAAPLIRAGKMPHFAELIARGTSGFLYTETPARSPTVWTTVATGKRRKDHGILDFADPTGVPYTSESRRGKALWNIASDYNLHVATIGWWVTWPAEEIRGVMVAPYSAAGQNNVNWKGNFYDGLPEQTWPPELFDEVWPIAQEVGKRENVDRLSESYFGNPNLDEMFSDLDESQRDDQRDLLNKLLGQTRWSISADETYSAIASSLLAKEEPFPDLTMVYYGGTDVASHRFWQFMRPDDFHYTVHPDAVKYFGSTIANFYQRADDQLGRILALLPADANIIVCSDHGFHANSIEQPSPIGISGHHQTGPPGIVVMAGPDIREGLGAKAILSEEGSILDMGWIYDVHPIALYLLGIPIGRDVESPDCGPLMKAIRKEVTQSRPLSHVVTHDDGFRLPKPPRQASQGATNMFETWMRELGYSSDSESGDERSGPADHDKTPLESDPGGNHRDG